MKESSIASRMMELPTNITVRKMAGRMGYYICPLDIKVELFNWHWIYKYGVNTRFCLEMQNSLTNFIDHCILLMFKNATGMNE